MNSLDRLISWVSPRAGLHRARDRAALSYVRAYEGAQKGRLTDGWVAGGGSANVEISRGGATLRYRARDLVRNTPWGRRAKRAWVNSVVGRGIVPRADTGNDRLNRQIDDAFALFARNCDADGVFNFYGLQALVAGAEFESGEVFTRFRNRRVADGLDVPLQLQVLESDYCDSARQAWGTTVGGYCLQGIEFDSLGQKIGFWLFSQHPGEMIVQPKQTLISKLIPAVDVMQVYWPDRPGQVRGVTRFAPVMTAIRDLDDWEDAELLRKKIEACFVAFVTQPDGGAGPVLGDLQPQSADGRIESLEPGLVEYLKPGQDIQFAEPTATPGHVETKRSKLHDIAAGLGVTYEQITMDLSQVNYSSFRGGRLEVRAEADAFREQVLIPQFCDPVWRRFVDIAFVAGLIRKVDYGVRWSQPEMPSVDPKKDAEADTLEIRAGTHTLAQKVAARGGNIDSQIAEIAATNTKLDAVGVILDSDPRKTAKAGGPIPTMNNEGASSDASGN